MEDTINILRYDFNNLDIKEWCDIRLHSPNIKSISNTALAYSVTKSGARRMLKGMFPLNKSFFQSLEIKLIKYDFTHQPDYKTHLTY